MVASGGVPEQGARCWERSSSTGYGVLHRRTPRWGEPPLQVPRNCAGTGGGLCSGGHKYSHRERTAGHPPYPWEAVGSVRPEGCSSLAAPSWPEEGASTAGRRSEVRQRPGRGRRRHLDDLEEQVQEGSALRVILQRTVAGRQLVHRPTPLPRPVGRPRKVVPAGLRRTVDVGPGHGAAAGPREAQRLLGRLKGLRRRTPVRGVPRRDPPALAVQPGPFLPGRAHLAGSTRRTCTRRRGAAPHRRR